MQDPRPNNQDQPVTKSELDKALAATEGRIEQLVSITKSDLELLAEQTNVILGAVDERLQAQKSDIVILLGEKLDKKFDQVMTGLDAVMKEYLLNDPGKH